MALVDLKHDVGRVAAGACVSDMLSWALDFATQGLGANGRGAAGYVVQELVPAGHYCGCSGAHFVLAFGIKMST